MANESLAARPYARAVFELATGDGGQDGGAYDRWSDTLAFWSAVVSDPAMHDRLAEPGSTAADKAKLIEQVSENIDDDGRNLLGLLAENERLGAIPDIAAEFERLRGEAMGEVEAHVVSAYELSDEQSTRLVEALGKRFSRTVRLTTEVDTDLIGGAIVHAGDLVIDGSIRGRLAGLERSVTG